VSVAGASSSSRRLPLVRPRGMMMHGMETNQMEQDEKFAMFSLRNINQLRHVTIAVECLHVYFR